MSLNIGFSIEAKQLAKPESSELLGKLLDAGCTTIQIHGHSDLVGVELADPALIRQFSYRAIHLPELHGPNQDRDIIAAAKKLGEKVVAHSYALHPTGMESFRWLHDEFGASLSMENMDWRKSFGKEPADLQKVFSELPLAGWIFDVNHVKTNDPSMHLANDLYEIFADRLTAYHLSGFADERLPHTLLADTHQDDIIAKVTDLSKPIILESLAPEDYARFKEELYYVQTRL